MVEDSKCNLSKEFEVGLVVELDSVAVSSSVGLVFVLVFTFVAEQAKLD